ncbi:GNAT family N-acetyltransferase [Lentibacillus jeotgali]|uniref:GNAT family N-acetyltransferase n=1 Tax=Lentibacillus jeotgali TaxID=558169 RepID=UPI000262787E|nr:GNAT family N-acetyltransferase [Lentibacillus jeotgali]
MTEITIKSLSTMAELHAMQKVESAVWHMDPVPDHQTFTALKNGGILLGAYDGDKMVGFLYSFPGFKDSTSYLCSHMMGILPAYQTSGAGVRLKLKQAEVAREMGYRLITWTFDPLESRNAYLNLHKLEAVGAWYKANYYGDMQDDLNQGLPSDRVHIMWDLTRSNANPAAQFQGEQVLLDGDQGRAPVVKAAFHTADFSTDNTYFVAIPRKFQAIKQTSFELAKEWRLETRKVFEQLFERGFRAVDLLQSDEDYSYYVFAK